MRLRTLNEAGIVRFEDFLRSWTTATPGLYPAELLDSDEYSDALEPSIDVDDRGFTTRFELAAYLCDLFDSSDLVTPEHGRGIWAWLALYWFNHLCPERRNGWKRPGALPRWIPELESWNRYYRHLVLGPYLAYRAHADDPRRAMVILATNPSAPGDVVEQLASRQMLVTCPSVMSAATTLYCDGNGSLKAGVADKDDSKGGVRRMAAVLQQLDRTFDLPSLTGDSLIGLLPQEIRRWRK
jgi:hypothetical protein